MSGRLFLFVLSLILIVPYLCLVSAGATYMKILAKRAWFFLGVCKGGRSV